MIALRQDAGKGRQGREWKSAEGNFFGSTLVVVRAGDPPASSLSLIAGLALIEAVDSAAPGKPLMLKWPNDLLLGGKKLAGILLERSGDRVVVGFGVNLAGAPELHDRQASALGGVISAEDFAPILSAGFSRMLALWRASGSGLIAQAWMARAHPRGSNLTVHVTPDDKIAGRFDGIDADGALRLWTEKGVEIIRAGDVEL